MWWYHNDIKWMTSLLISEHTQAKWPSHGLTMSSDLLINNTLSVWCIIITQLFSIALLWPRPVVDISHGIFHHYFKNFPFLKVSPSIGICRLLKLISWHLITRCLAVTGDADVFNDYFMYNSSIHCYSMQCKDKLHFTGIKRPMAIDLLNFMTVCYGITYHYIAASYEC